MSATEFSGLSVLGGPISTNTTRTTAAGTQAEGGGVSSDRGMFVDPRFASPYSVPGTAGNSQTGPMSFVEAVGKIIV